MRHVNLDCNYTLKLLNVRNLEKAEYDLFYLEFDFPNIFYRSGVCGLGRCLLWRYHV